MDSINPRRYYCFNAANLFLESYPFGFISSLNGA